MRPLAVVASLVALLAAPALAAADSPPPGAVRAVLELGQQIYYAGEPLRVRISVGNDGATEARNPVTTPLPRGFEVRAADGKRLDAKGPERLPETSRPSTLAPGYAYSAAIDLAERYPELRSPGTYEIRWAADGLESPTIVVRLIPKYDPAKEYRARIETDEGTFVIDFFGKAAPLATKAFIDMANTGFYDGLIFHRAVGDHFSEGGDRQGDGAGAPPFRYPADPTAIPPMAGTLLMKPVSPTPPTNGSQFIVLVRPEPTWTGQATVFAQVVEGLDVVQRISRLPTTQQAAHPYFKPLKDIRIVRVTVFEKAVAK